MNPRRASYPTIAAAIALASLIVVAGCGPDVPSGSVDPGDSVVGTPTPTATVPSTLPSPVPSTSGTTATPSASSSASASDSALPSASATARPTATPAPGNASTRLCARLPVTDVEVVLSVSSLTARPETPSPGTGACTYLSGDRAVAATSWLTNGAQQAIAAFGATAEPVPGLADEAVWVESIVTLYIRKGDRLMGISVAVAGPVAREDLRAASISLGQAAAERL